MFTSEFDSSSAQVGISALLPLSNMAWTSISVPNGSDEKAIGKTSSNEVEVV